MLNNLLVTLLNHHLQSVVFLTATESMEVKVEELQFAFLFKFVYLPDVLRSDADLPRSIVAQQVDNVARTVGIKDVLKVLAEWLLCHLSIARKTDIFC